MPELKLEQLIKTRIVFSVQYWLRETQDVTEIVRNLKRKWPEVHHQTLRGIVLRVAKANVSGQLLTQGLLTREKLEEMVPRFQGWQSENPEYANLPFHYAVLAELKTYRGRKSHHRHFEISSSTILSKEQIQERIAEIIAQRQERDKAGSPPEGQVFTKVLSVNVEMLWRA